MKVSTRTAVLLATVGVAQAIPLPNGLLSNVHDDCSGSTSSSCIPTSQFLHHLVDSDVKYTHLVHPQTNQLIPISNSALAPSSLKEEESEKGPDGASRLASAPAGTYPNENHPSSSTPFKSGANFNSNLGGTGSQSTLDPTPNTPSTSRTTADSTSPPEVGNPAPASGGLDVNLMAPVNEDNPNKKTPDSSSAKPPNPQGQGNALVPNGTDPDQLVSKSALSSLPADSKLSPPKQTEAKSTDDALPKSPEPPKVADDKAVNRTQPTLPKPQSNVTVADATGVAHAPGLVGSPDGALGGHRDVIAPLCTVVLAAIGAVWLL